MVDGADLCRVRHVFRHHRDLGAAAAERAHVPEATIASITAVTVSPLFWTFLISPVLDVRFSRRWYAVLTAVLAAAALVLALLELDHPVMVEAFLFAGSFFVTLYGSALGGWLSSITTADEKKRLSSGRRSATSAAAV